MQCALDLKTQFLCQGPWGISRQKHNDDVADRFTPYATPAWRRVVISPPSPTRIVGTQMVKSPHAVG